MLLSYATYNVRCKTPFCMYKAAGGGSKNPRYRCVFCGDTHTLGVEKENNRSLDSILAEITTANKEGREFVTENKVKLSFN